VLADKECATEVDVDHVAVVLPGRLLERLDQHDARDVREHVDATEFVGGTGDERRDGFFVAHVTRHRNRAQARIE
jgi:hypothetical protein